MKDLILGTPTSDVAIPSLTVTPCGTKSAPNCNGVDPGWELATACWVYNRQQRASFLPPLTPFKLTEWQKPAQVAPQYALPLLPPAPFSTEMVQSSTGARSLPPPIVLG